MSSTPTEKLVDEIIKRSLHPILKSAGYMKKWRTFYLESDEAIRVVNVQSSQGNTAESSKFTINLGVYFPAVQPMSLHQPLDGLPKEHECTIRERIGMLMPRQNDWWWRVHSKSNLDMVANAIRNAWTGYGQPWIDRCGTLAAACDEAEHTGDTFTAAMIAVASGDLPRAKRNFDLKMKTCNPAAHGTLKAWAKRHGIQFS